MTTTNTIILVVAERGDQELVSQALGNERFEIHFAESADDASRQLDQPIDLVVCDLCLDTQDCHDLMRQWHDQRPSTPFILLTKEDDVADAIKAMQHGAADYVTKPINGEELLVRIEKWLETSRKVERLKQLESRFDGDHREDSHNGPSIDIPAGTSLEDLERVAVERALEMHHGNRTHAAKTLGISVRTLQRKLKAWRVPVLALQHHATHDFSMPAIH